MHSFLVRILVFDTIYTKMIFTFMSVRYYHATLNLIYFNSRLEGDPILNRFLQAELEPQKHLFSFFLCPIHPFN